MSNFTDLLKEKFIKHNIPEGVADSFLASYRSAERGLYPEIKLSAIPSDDCFKTLSVYCDSVEDEPSDFLVSRLLQIPFSKIQMTKNKLLDFVDASVVEKRYKETYVYFARPEFVDELRAFLESKSIRQVDYSKWFIDAMILGDGAIDLVNDIFELFDECTATKIVSQAYIWYPYSDPIGLITYLSEQKLTNAQICDLLTNDPRLIIFYSKDKTFRDLHDQEYVDAAIAKVKSDQ